MKLQNIVQKTGVVSDAMTIREGFAECVRNNVPGIPYVDATGKVIGTFSIRRTILSSCIPDVMVAYADLLGDDTDCLNIPEQNALKLLSLPANSFINKEVIAISSDTAVSKTIALMENHKVNYLFVIDEDRYIGVVTVDAIANRMLELHNDSH
jgi:predicted transcriptional regulator